MAINQYDVLFQQNMAASGLEYEGKFIVPAANSLMGFDSSKVVGNVTATVATGGISITSGAILIAPASITATCTVPHSTEDYLIISDNGTLSKVTVGNLMSAADVKVAVDAGATAGYLGADGASGVLRVTTNDLTVADGGDYITLSLGSNAVKKVAAPAAYNSTGTAGTIAYDDNYLYIFTATNVNKRVALMGNWAA
jgi:hypothetical protein